MVLIQMELPEEVDKYIRVRQAALRPNQTKEDIILQMLRECVEKDVEVSDLIKKVLK